MPYISTYKNYMLVVEEDEFCDNPREWDSLGTMLCWHRRYKLGDENPYDNLRSFLEEMVGLYLDTKLDEETEFEKFSDNELFEILIKNDFVILPIYLYDHSGITISTSGFGDRWDSGCVGLIYVNPEKIKQEFVTVNDSIKKIIKKRLEGEVADYADYLEGNCYCFTLYDLIDGDVIDGVGSFIGDIDEVKQDIGCYLDCSADDRKVLLDNLHWEDKLKTTTTIDFAAYRKECV